jgi:pimeloyl-ACP methyl ester carboxylesterase
MASPRIRVFYYGRLFNSKNVVLFYNGGPGSDSHGSYRTLEKDLVSRGLQGKISFVYMDQRGTGCSSTYPAGRTDDVLQRLKWYGSTGIVYDSEALRAKLLGSARWKVFGQSYGAFIVHRYVTLFPRSLDKAYAHANAISPDSMTRLEERISSQFRVWGLYLATPTFADDEARLQRLSDLLTANTCVTVSGDNLCGHELLEGLVNYLGWSNRWPDLHLAIGKLLSPGDPATAKLNQDALTKFAQAEFANTFPESGPAITAIGAFDRNVVPSNTLNCTEIYRRLQLSLGAGYKAFIPTECMGATQSYFHSNFHDHVDQLFAGHQNLLTIDALKTGASQMTPDSFFVYSGERDCYVPMATFDNEVTALGSLMHYTHFMTTGHDGYRTEAQVWSDLQL